MVAGEIDIDDTGSLIFRRGTGHAAPGAVIGRRRERWVASPSMRVLGVDPGLTRCGLGVVEGTGGRSVRAVAVDVVRTPPDDELAARLGLVADVVERWIAEHRPDVVAVERPPAPRPTADPSPTSPATPATPPRTFARHFRSQTGTTGCPEER